MDVVYLLLTAYVSWRVTVMIDYALTYGQLLDFIKVFFALKVNPKSVKYGLVESRKMSIIDASEYMEGVFDYVQTESKLFRLISCTYCLGYWISLLFALPFCLLTSFWWGLLFIPLLTFHLIEKL